MNPVLLELLMTLLADFANELPAAVQAVHNSPNGAGKTAAGLAAVGNLASNLQAVQPAK